MSGALSRCAAADLLIEIIENKRMMEEALDIVASYNALQGPDRGFARAMASAALRQLGRIDLGLKPFLNRPLEDSPPAARALLRIGAAQAWMLGTPAHASVGETVNAAKQMPGAKNASGFLNAVLRKVAAEASGLETSAPETTWPVWLQKSFEQSLGTQQVRQLARGQSLEPALHLTAKSGDAADLAATVGGEQIGPATIALPTTAVEAISGYETGDWWVQDLAAALPVQILAPQAGEHVIDLCAAPGGKTMQIAAAGARVTAVDRSRKRLERVHENLERTGLAANVEVVAANAETWRPKELADAILLDAPCSALGTLRRHPEGAWIKTQDAIARFPDIQGRLLAAAAQMVKPGGRVIYCVCTPLQAEGANVVETAIGRELYARSPIITDKLSAFAGSVTTKGDVLTIPAEAPLHDAFFIAQLIRS